VRLLPSGELTSYPTLRHQLAWAGRKHTSAIYLSRGGKNPISDLFCISLGWRVSDGADPVSTPNRRKPAFVPLDPHIYALMQLTRDFSL